MHNFVAVEGKGNDNMEMNSIGSLWALEYELRHLVTTSTLKFTVIRLII